MQVGNRTFSINQLNQITSDALKKLGELSKNSPNKKLSELEKEFFGSVEKTIETLGKELGTKIVK
ncbi:MAG: hypothetical protein MUF43_13700 [Flavobacterium sp.]|nr:hypothetical protein [Flavobacterium sp.]